MPGVKVGETQRPHGRGKILRRDGGGELACVRREAAGSVENLLQSPARVTVGGAQREQVDGGDREAEAQRDRGDERQRRVIYNKNKKKDSFMMRRSAQVRPGEFLSLVESSLSSRSS